MSSVESWSVFAVFTYNEVVPDVIGDFVEEGYAHVGILVVERRNIIGIVCRFCEERQCETPPLVRGLAKDVVSMALCSLLLGWPLARWVGYSR